MSEGKIAAQVAHAVKNLGTTPVDCNIVVLKVSDKKFEELKWEKNCYIQRDKGLTEVETGTETALAWIEGGDVNNCEVYTKTNTRCFFQGTLAECEDYIEKQSHVWKNATFRIQQHNKILKTYPPLKGTNYKERKK